MPKRPTESPAPCALRRGRRARAQLFALVFGIVAGFGGGARELHAKKARAASKNLNPDTGEVRNEQMLRSQPQLGSRTLGKVPRHATVTVIEQKGAWVLVKWRRSVGWLPQAAFSRLPDGSGSEAGRGAPAEPINDPGPPPSSPPEPSPAATAAEAAEPARTERQARFVKKDTRFPDQGIPSNVQRVVVVAASAALLARPADNAPVVGTANTFEELAVVRQSRDGSWYLVDLGGGETAWVSSNSVRPGDKKRGFKGQLAIPNTAPRGKGWSSSGGQSDTGGGRSTGSATGTATGAAVARPLAASAAPPSGGTDEGGTDEAATTGDSGDEPSDAASGDAAEPQVADSPEVIAARDETMHGRSDKPPGFLRNVQLHVSLGYSAWSQEFRSNAADQLANYKISAGGAMLGINAEYTRPLGQRLFFRALAGYRLTISTSGIDVPPAMAGGQPVNLGYLEHGLDLSGQLLVPVWRRRIRPFVRLGAEVVFHQIGSVAQAPLPSDRILALILGFGAEAPLRVFKRAMVARAELDLLTPAQRLQTGGLREGTSSSTFGLGLDIGAWMRLTPSWTAGFDYRYESFKSSFEGPHDPKRTVADGGTRTDTAHMLLLSAGYWL